MKTPERVPFVLFSFLYGEIARWATRQSPYHAPEGLVEVLSEFQKRLNHLQRCEVLPNIFPYPYAIRAEREILRNLLNTELLTLPQVQAWNERKNGNKAPFGFCSRYDQPVPDDDFIDLDALTGNIVRSCIQEDLESWEKDRQRHWWEKDWWYLLKLKFQHRSVIPSSPENPKTT